MEFYELYPEFSRLSVRCGKLDSYIKIKTISVGSGGSNNVIIIGKLKYNGKIIAIKIIPFLMKAPAMVERNPKDQNEIKFYELFTREIVLKKITPHIIGMYKSKHCNDIRNILPNTCLTIEQALFKAENASLMQLCNLYRMLLDKIIGKQFDVALLEFCPADLSGKLWEISELKTSKIINFLNRLVFQVAFTLAHLYIQYPDFQHGDLFIRNILGIDVDHYKNNEYFEYTYDNYKFYLPANGYFVKITDFGQSRLDHLIPTNKVFIDPKSREVDHLSDMFNFLHDIYNGQELGANSLMTTIRSKNKREAVRNYLKEYIDVNYIDRFNENNKSIFDNMWNISSYNKIIKATKIREPKEYLKLFLNVYPKLPNNGRIVETFGK
jgi:hypothetical protein